MPPDALWQHSPDQLALLVDHLLTFGTRRVLHAMLLAVMQVVEDALCLVFTEHQFADLLACRCPPTLMLTHA
jgi:hypothetical protein